MNSGAGKIHTVLLVVLLSVLGVAYLMLYSSTWLDMERVWRSSATYNHCYLILPISLYFFYHNRHLNSGRTVSAQWIWLPACTLILLQLLWVGYFYKAGQLWWFEQLYRWLSVKLERRAQDTAA